MYRKNIKWIAAALAAVLVIGGAATIHAGTVATEKPMAGINLSLDKYSDAVLAEQEKEVSYYSMSVVQSWFTYMV